jgi:hypothetical protein
VGIKVRPLYRVFAVDHRQGAGGHIRDSHHYNVPVRGPLRTDVDHFPVGFRPGEDFYRIPGRQTEPIKGIQGGISLTRADFVDR